MDASTGGAFTRREMLSLAMKLGVGTLAGAALLKASDFFASSAEAAEPSGLKEALFYDKLPGGKVKCTLCPRMVTLEPGKSCFCKTRRNEGGVLRATGFKKPCVVNFEPIERGPLYHYLPGTDTMAMGAAGCNMECLYCQNYELAQSPPEKVKALEFDPAAALKAAKAKSLTLTYTDSSCQPEYLMELSDVARRHKAPLILCTGAYINQRPLEEIIKKVDAFAITLKAATDEAYLKLTGVDMKPVLDSLVKIKSSGKWLEVVTLVVPEYNDEQKGIESLAKWIRSNLGEDTPWHISRFTPNYKLRKLPPTPRKTMEEARKIGQDAGLKFVYITNLAPHEGNNSYCPSCKKAIVERLAFKTLKSSIVNGKCKFCGTRIPGVWTFPPA